MQFWQAIILVVAGSLCTLAGFYLGFDQGKRSKQINFSDSFSMDEDTEKLPDKNILKSREEIEEEQRKSGFYN